MNWDKYHVGGYTRNQSTNAVYKIINKHSCIRALCIRSGLRHRQNNVYELTNSNRYVSYCYAKGQKLIKALQESREDK